MMSGGIWSSWEVGTWKRRGGLFLDSIWISIKYGELLSYAKHGVRATRDLVTQVVAMLETINQSEPPTAVSEITSELASLVERLELLHGRSSESARSDGVARQRQAGVGFVRRAL
jgi:hypothetical protein